MLNVVCVCVLLQLGQTFQHSQADRFASPFFCLLSGVLFCGEGAFPKAYP